MRPAGYEALRIRYRIDGPAPAHRSFVSPGHGRRTDVDAQDVITELYPARYQPAEDDLAQLVFALKYDGVHLPTLDRVFRHVGGAALTRAIREHPTSRYLRRIWYLYEWLTGEVLDVPDLTQGNYVPVLDPSAYYTVPPRRSRRHRVDDNQLGPRGWCPEVRRTADLVARADARLSERAREVARRFDPALIARAVNYLFTQETRASYLIEREEPGPTRVERFVALLREARTVGELAGPLRCAAGGRPARPDGRLGGRDARAGPAGRRRAGGGRSGRRRRGRELRVRLPAPLH